MRRTCSEDDCTSPVSGRGLCRKHYRARTRAGTLPDTWERRPQGTTGGTRRAPSQWALTCSADGCADPAHSRGLCAIHYAAAYRAGTLPTEYEVGREPVGQRHGSYPMAVVKRCPCEVCTARAVEILGPVDTTR